MDQTYDRRSVLRASAAGVVLGAGVVAAGTTTASAAEPVFAHGVASGDPLPDAVLLWTRVTPTPDATPGSGVGPTVDVTWEVAADPAFATVVASGVVSTGPGRDHTVKVDATGLNPATTYHYRFRLAGAVSAVGTTRTAPALSAAVARLRFGVVSCSNVPAGSSWASDVPRDAGLYPLLSPSVATEFVCTSVTSDNIDEILDVPPRTVSPTLEAAIRALNRHIKYVELDSHGASVLEVTPSGTQMDWYYLANKADPASALTWARSFRTRAGTQRVQSVGTPIGN